jgi:hypothetical protein
METPKSNFCAILTPPTTPAIRIIIIFPGNPTLILQARRPTWLIRREKRGAVRQRARANAAVWIEMITRLLWDTVLPLSRWQPRRAACLIRQQKRTAARHQRRANSGVWTT